MGQRGQKHWKTDLGGGEGGDKKGGTFVTLIMRLPFVDVKCGKAMMFRRRPPLILSTTKNDLSKD